MMVIEIDRSELMKVIVLSSASWKYGENFRFLGLIQFALIYLRERKGKFSLLTADVYDQHILR